MYHRRRLRTYAYKHDDRLLMCGISVMCANQIWEVGSQTQQYQSRCLLAINLHISALIDHRQVFSNVT